MKDKLSHKHKCAALLHLSGMSQPKALRAVGYSESLSTKRPAHVFKRPDVMAFIEAERQMLIDKLDVSKEWVTRELIAIVQTDATLAKFKKVDPGTGQLYWDFRGAMEGELALIDTLIVDTTYGLKGKTMKCKISSPSRQAAIDSLCRIYGFNKDPLADALGLSLVERLQAGRDRSSKREEDGGGGP